MNPNFDSTQADSFHDDGKDEVSPEFAMIGGTVGLSFDSREDDAIQKYLKELGM